MPSAHELAAEMAHVSDYIRQQMSMQLNNFDINGMQRSLVARIVAQIGSLNHMTPEGAGVLTTALASSAYDSVGKTLIANAINTRVGVVDTSRDTIFQTLTSINKYLTQQDHDDIGDATKPLADRVNVVVRRLRLLRIIHPSTETIRFAAALLGLLAFSQYPSYQSMYNLVRDLQSNITTALGPVDAGIRTYPNDPNELPSAVYEAAYADGPPVTVALDRLLNTARNHVPLRNTSKLLRPSQTQGDGSLQIANQPQSATRSDDLALTIAQQVGSVMQQCMSQLMCYANPGHGPRGPQPPPQFDLTPPPQSSGDRSPLANALRPRGPRAIMQPQAHVYGGASSMAPLTDTPSHHVANADQNGPSGMLQPSPSHDELPGLTFSPTKGRVPGDQNAELEGAAFVGRGTKRDAPAAAIVNTDGDGEDSATQPPRRKLHKVSADPQPISDVLAMERAIMNSMEARDNKRSDNRKELKVVKDAAEKAVKAAIAKAKATTAEASKEGNHAVCKKPAASPTDLKRASRARAAEARPPPSRGTKANPSPTTLYGGGKIHVSWSKDCFRVFRQADHRVDVAVRWHDDWKAAWTKSLDLIDQHWGRIP